MLQLPGLTGVTLPCHSVLCTSLHAQCVCDGRSLAYLAHNSVLISLAFFTAVTPGVKEPSPGYLYN